MVYIYIYTFTYVHTGESKHQVPINLLKNHIAFSHQQYCLLGANRIFKQTPSFRLLTYTVDGIYKYIYMSHVTPMIFHFYHFLYSL